MVSPPHSEMSSEKVEQESHLKLKEELWILAFNGIAVSWVLVDILFCSFLVWHL